MRVLRKHDDTSFILLTRPEDAGEFYYIELGDGFEYLDRSANHF